MWPFDMIVSGIKKVGNAIGCGVEKIGELTHISAIENAGFNLQCACDFGKTAWDDNSSTSDTVDVHKELNKVIESIRPSATSAERQIIKICINEVGEILVQFKEIIPCPDLKRLDENFRAEIQNDLSGQLMRFIQPRLSLDDKECKKILETRNDDERKRKADEFKKKVLSEAESKFKSKCAGEKKKYCEKMLDIADDSLASLQEETKKQNELLQQKLQEVTDEQTIDFEREQTLITSEKLSVLGSIAFDLGGLN